MSNDKKAIPQPGVRPRSKAFLRLSLDNPYAQLEVSPLASTEEIANRIDELRSKAFKRSRAKATRDINDEDEQQVLRLDKIAEAIGDVRRRSMYDERFPQNILLTVQQSPAERAWQRHRRAGLISEWLYETLGEDALLPTPRCLKLWAPSGLDPSLLDVLAGFARTQEPPALQQESSSAPPIELEAALSLQELDRLTKES